MPIPAVVLALLPQLIAALPSLAKIVARAPDTGGEKPSVSERNIKLAEKVGEIVMGATGADTVEGAVRQIQTDPGAQQRADIAIAASFAELMDLLRFEEESRGKAREYGMRMMEVDTPSAKMWRAIAFGMLLYSLSIGVVLGGGWILREVLMMDGTDLQTKGMIIGALIAAVMQVLSYFFGSSANSRTKDQTIADQARQR